MDLAGAKFLMVYSNSLAVMGVALACTVCTEICPSY